MAWSEQETPAAPQLDLAAEFKDKIVMLEVNRSSALESKSSSLVVEHARIAKAGDRYFIMGTSFVPEGSDNEWYRGVTVGVAWDSVLRFYAYTPKQFEEYLKKWKDRSSE